MTPLTFEQFMAAIPWAAALGVAIGVVQGVVDVIKRRRSR
jgi:hypothetical protein